MSGCGDTIDISAHSSGCYQKRPFDPNADFPNIWDRESGGFLFEIGLTNTGSQNQDLWIFTVKTDWFSRLRPYSFLYIV